MAYLLTLLREQGNDLPIYRGQNISRCFYAWRVSRYHLHVPHDEITSYRVGQIVTLVLFE